MSIKIVKGSYSSVVDSASLSGNQTLTLPNASGTVALTNQFATVATSGSYNDLSGKPTLAKVATSGSYNDLSNKPSIPSTPKGYITQTWRSGANWYRVYNDGWIEQGGQYTPQTSGNQTKTISFHKSFTNTNYVAIKFYKTTSTRQVGLDTSGTNSHTKSNMKTLDIPSGGSIGWYVIGN